jgi:hypothetical protein
MAKRKEDAPERLPPGETLAQQQAEAARLDAAIAKNLEVLAHGL